MLCPRARRRSLPQRHTLLARCPRLPLPLCCNNRCSCRLPGAPQLRHLCRRSLQALPRRSPTPTRTTFWTGQWVCCAPRPTNWPSPRRQAPTRSSNRCAFSPSPPNCTPSRTWRLTGRYRQQQRPQLALHAGLGGHEGVGCRLFHRGAAHVKPSQRDEAARCSHVRPDRRSTSQAWPVVVVVGHLLQAHGSPPLCLLARPPARLWRGRWRVSPTPGRGSMWRWSEESTAGRDNRFYIF